jgi:hypothetical protein
MMAYQNSRTLFQATVSLALALGAGLSMAGQTATTQSAPAAPAAQASSPNQAADGSTQPVRRRRFWRRSAQPQPATSQAATDPQTVGPTPEQRTRDAQILAAQKAQSAEIARQNAITTGNVVKERAAQQAEPRIQDAPGPDSQPLAGDPAIQPAAPAEAPRIQDAPGPAQTLPQAPPSQTAAPTPQ